MSSALMGFNESECEHSNDPTVSGSVDMSRFDEMYLRKHIMTL